MTIKSQDVFGAAPKTVLNKPYMQVQNRKGIGVNGATLPATGSQTRELNTVVVGNITGASLSSNQVTLPAGTYYIEGTAEQYMNGLSVAVQGSQVVLEDSSGNQLIYGNTIGNYMSGSDNWFHRISGEMVLQSSTTVELVHYTNTTGGTVSEGTEGDISTGVNIYTNLEIWKLDEDMETIIQVEDTNMTLARPLLHVQETQPSGTHGGTNVAGDNFRVFNTITTNDISGASVNSDTITLPAGTYECRSDSILYKISLCKATLEDSTGTVLLTGTSQVSAGGDSNTQVLTIKGRFTLSATTDIKLNNYGSVAQASNGLGAAISQGTEVYADLSIWKLDSLITTPVLDDPTMIGARPLFEAIQTANVGVGLDTSTNGWYDYQLNTTPHNDISGAGLAGGNVTLPAGTYFAEVNSGPLHRLDGTVVALRDLSDTIYIRGTEVFVRDGTSGNIMPVGGSGQFTLTETTTLKVSVYVSNSAQNNTVGYPLSIDGLDEYYGAVKIWQLDALRQTPVLVNDKLFPLPGNTLVTGNMHGLEYSYTNASQVTVEAGLCMDSINTTLLDLPTQQVVTIGTTINTVYNLFLCDDQVVRTDTDVNGTNLSAYKFRWIGFVRNNSAGDMCKFVQKGDGIIFTLQSEGLLATVTITDSTVDHSVMMPVSRVAYVQYGASGTAGRYITSRTTNTETEAWIAMAGGLSDTASSAWGSTANDVGGLIPFHTTRLFWASANVYLLLHQVVMKR